MEAFLSEFLRRYPSCVIDWRAINYGSKQQLLARLPRRMAGYARMPVKSRPLSLVLVDRDDDDCVVLKRQLDSACGMANLTTRTTAVGGVFEVVNRIVIEELEAWFLGDVVALDREWPGTARVMRQAAYRDPDAVRGGTHEALLRVLQGAGHRRELTRLPKIDTARAMGILIDPARNTSRSFQQFWMGLAALSAFA